MGTLPVSIYCPYCRRYTSLTPAPTAMDSYTCVWEQGHNDIWWIGICNYCKRPVLVHNKGDTVYPHPLPSPSDERIPEDIRKP